MKLSPDDGFSIIEMVMVIVVSGILAIGIVDYIGNAVDGIATSTSRNQLATAGRVALDRMGIELHNALPNSIRTTTADPVTGNQCIEFVPIKAATSYLNPPFGAGGGTVFNVIAFTPDQVGVTGVYAAIYPDKIADIYDGGTVSPYDTFPFRGPIAKISSIANSAPAGTNAITITLHRFHKESPYKRLFLIQQPISFCVNGSKLYRYTNYGFLKNQPYVESACTNPGWTPAGCGLPSYATTNKILITDSIDNTGLTAFSASAQSLTRNALVSFKFRFSSEGDSIEISHESMSRSVP